MKMASGDEAISIMSAITSYMSTDDEEDLEHVRKVMGETNLNVKWDTLVRGRVLKISPLQSAAAVFESTKLVEVFMNDDAVDTSLEYENCKDENERGNVLDLVVRQQPVNLDVVRCILDNDRELKLVTVDEHGFAFILNDAVHNNNSELAELLLEYESSYPHLNPVRCLALAMRYSQVSIFTKILSTAKHLVNNLVPNLACPNCPIPNCTLLHLAICFHNPKIVKLLLQAGSDVNSTQGHPHGCTPLMHAIQAADNHGCKGNCQERVVSELLCAEGIDLDIQTTGSTKITALEFVQGATCHVIKKQVEQAYSRLALRKKMMKRRETKAEVRQPPADSEQSKAASKPKRDKICWHCHAHPTATHKLGRCAGCRVAWYCGEECQGEDRDRHRDWCVKKEMRRKEKLSQ